MYQYLIGVDGGGTKTKVIIANRDGIALGVGAGGPSGLMLGADKAWLAILCAFEDALSNAGLTGLTGLARPPLAQIAAGFGLAGVNNKQWKAAFIAGNPGFGAMTVETDAFTTLTGAHQGRPGAIVAIGTGSVGEALLADGTRREVGGWGFPAGDEAGGAWLGLQAIGHIQSVLDGRNGSNRSSDFAQAVITACGGNSSALLAWLARADQTAYAQLAPLVVAHAAHDAHARSIMIKAGRAVEKMATALDASDQLPIALCGGLAVPLQDFLPASLVQRAIAPHADSAAGAVILARRNGASSPITTVRF